LYGSTFVARFGTRTISFGPSRLMATSAVMIFVVDAIGRRMCGRFAKSTVPVPASMTIAAGAVTLGPCVGGDPSSVRSGVCETPTRDVAVAPDAASSADTPAMASQRTITESSSAPGAP
jgi:hypothetical protein